MRCSGPAKPDRAGPGLSPPPAAVTLEVLFFVGPQVLEDLLVFQGQFLAINSSSEESPDFRVDEDVAGRTVLILRLLGDHDDLTGWNLEFGGHGVRDGRGVPAICGHDDHDQHAAIAASRRSPQAR
jgi:hypothetical protein